MNQPPPLPPGMVSLPRPMPPAAPAVVPNPIAVADPTAPPQRSTRPTEPAEPRLRNVLAALLAVVATGLIASSVLLGWVDRTVLPTPSFVKTGGPVITDPAVAVPLQQQLTEQVGAQLTSIVTTTGDSASAPFDAGAFNTAVAQAAEAAVASPVARASWDAALRATHVRSLDLARGAEPTPDELDGTAIVVDLGPLAAATRDQVALAGFPSVAGAQFGVAPYAITSSSSAVEASDGIRIADQWGWPLFLLGLLAAAAAYTSSTRKGRLTLLLGADLLVAAGALWVTARLVGNVAGDRGVTPDDQAALAALYAPFGRSLQQEATLTAVIGGILVIAAIIVLSVQGSSERRVRSSNDNVQPTPEPM